MLGYFGEPYLRFLPGGEVQENRNSPTTYQNEERYGSDAPDFAQPDADPDWVTVADDGTYAWHDHRAHWMQPIRPAGKAPGDRIVEQVIPLVVDGDEVDVTVISTWQDEPSMLPAALGVIIGLISMGGAFWLSRRGPSWAVALVPVAALATIAGWWQYTSFPPETGPRLIWGLLPTIALAASVVGGCTRPPLTVRRGRCGARCCEPVGDLGVRQARRPHGGDRSDRCAAVVRTDVAHRRLRGRRRRRRSGGLPALFGNLGTKPVPATT